MRFHATLTHTPESCPQGKGPIQDWSAKANEVGVELIAALVCAPAHTQFFVIETDDYSKLQELFRPVFGFCKAEIMPVRDYLQS